MNSAANRFKTFADPEDVAAAAASKATEAKKTAPQKKVVVKKLEANTNR